MTDNNLSDKSHWVYLVFFISGTAALIFENLWFHLSGFVVGNSIWGVTVVLAGFMGGLAIGNGLIACYGRFIEKPLRFYFFLEIIIGLSGMLLVLTLPIIAYWFAPLFQTLLDFPLALNTSRLLIVFLLLLVPTIAMGATLPLLVKALCHHDSNFGLILGRLYGWNTVGAVCGTLLPELILVEVSGIKNTASLAAMLNLIAALIILRLMRYQNDRQFSASGHSSSIDLSGLIKGKRFLIAAFISGALLLSLEIVWFRFLLLTISGTSMIFAIMLAIVLAGIGSGGLIAAYLYKRKFNLTSYLREISLASAIFILCSYFSFHFLHNFISSHIDNSVIWFTVDALFLMFPVSVLSGLLFTAFGKSLQEQISEEITTTGLLTLVNTLGAMTGAVIAGLILIPLVGMENSFLILILGYVGLSFIIPAATKKYFLLTYIILIPVILLLILMPYNHIYKYHFQKLADKWEATKIAEIREGLVATNLYLEYDRYGYPYYYRLITNNYSMAGNSVESERYMKLFSYLPAMLHKNLKSALLISFGVGSTADALTKITSLDSIDMVDISNDVFQLSHNIFSKAGTNPINDPRVKTHIEDGRFYLLTTTKKYDLITGEPPPPGLHKIVNLYSKEYFQLIYDRLNTDGIATYWLPVYQLHSDNSKSIIKSFCMVFKDCSLWTGFGLEWILMGTRNNNYRNTGLHFSGNWTSNIITEDLFRLGVEKPEQLGSLFLADSHALSNLTKFYHPVVDNYPKRIFKEPEKDTDSHFIYYLMEPGGAIERFRNSNYIKSIWPKDLIDKTLNYFSIERLIQKKDVSNHNDSYFLDDLHHLLVETDLTTFPLLLLDSNYKEQAIVDKLIKNRNDNVEINYLLALRNIANRDYSTAINYLAIYIQSRDAINKSIAMTLYIYVLCLNGNYDQVDVIIDSLHVTLPDDKNLQHLYRWLNMHFGTHIP